MGKLRKIELAPGQFWYSTQNWSYFGTTGIADFLDGFNFRPFTGKIIEAENVDPLTGKVTTTVKVTQRLSAYLIGEKLRWQVEDGQLAFRKSDGLLVPTSVADR